MVFPFLNQEGEIMRENEFIQMVAEGANVEVQQVEEFYNQMKKVWKKTLKDGESIDLGEDFGKLAVKKREYKLNENSPKTPKDSVYIVSFKESSVFKKELKIKD